RLIHNTTDNNNKDEEFVAAMQGIICASNLPPVRRLLDARSSQHAHQRIVLTGFSDPSFEYATSVMNDIHTFFNVQLGGVTQQSSVFTNYNDHGALEAINRYFTPVTHADNSIIIPFSEEVDPHGHLKTAAGDKYVHTDDNAVLYYRHSPGDKHLIDIFQRFEPTTPALFCVGDIVEIQVSFVSLPQRNDMSKMSLILRSVSLLDNRHRKAASIAWFASFKSAAKGKGKLSLKRKVGYSIDSTVGAHEEHSELKRSRSDPSMEIDHI
ncbi:hypothetical protein BJ165DRAFT_1355445, partial [Panaeolus papilionaceus]